MLKLKKLCVIGFGNLKAFEWELDERVSVIYAKENYHEHLTDLFEFLYYALNSNLDIAIKEIRRYGYEGFTFSPVTIINFTFYANSFNQEYVYRIIIGQNEHHKPVVIGEKLESYYSNDPDSRDLILHFDYGRGVFRNLNNEVLANQNILALGAYSFFALNEDLRAIRNFICNIKFSRPYKEYESIESCIEQNPSQLFIMYPENIYELNQFPEFVEYINRLSKDHQIVIFLSFQKLMDYFRPDQISFLFKEYKNQKPAILKFTDNPILLKFSENSPPGLAWNTFLYSNNNIPFDDLIKDWENQY